jgi:hypothetical protein
MAASAGPRTEGPEAARESHGSKEKVPDGVRARGAGPHRTMNRCRILNIAHWLSVNTLVSTLRVQGYTYLIALSVKG